ncbi:enoyl-CoA hydratase/isomerase family protein [Belnapia sp. T6]|uniref:Enoyl-CoA hydratase/isomerase family protein n=1 Tax=Belnapia mucosa TaxID=2804532 RepID=A0ABS1V4D5_9PROT|nr:enoyl-CoA hydratase [Belnapia mucosa]MBL6456549.1 enoyl-CoA hydratase/isomerase family protein [Belnapia mucosa]
MSQMEFAAGKILASSEGGVGRVVFNQPEKRNAMSVDMWTGLSEALDLFAEDASVRCVVLQGAGDKAFVSGADISQFEKVRNNADAQKEYDKLTSAGRRKLSTYEKPVIAQIRGFCMGGGLGIAMSTDIRIASEDSQFAIPAAKLSIAYGFDMVRALVDLVGPAHAHMILMTGERFDASEAERIGLVNRVVPVDQLDATVAKLTATLASNAPLSLRTNKMTVKAACADRSDRDMAKLQAAMAACFDSNDYREGRRAFMEKRKPAFTGS